MGQNKRGGKDATRYLSIGLLSILPLYAGEAVYVVANQMLFKTTDYGISWSRIGYELPPLTCVTGYLVDSAPNYYILYAGAGKDGVYKSIDLGYSWVPINNGLPLPLLDSAYKIVVNPANHAELFLVCMGRAIYYSSNGGDYWSYFPPPEGYLYSLRRQ